MLILANKLQGFRYMPDSIGNNIGGLWMKYILLLLSILVLYYHYVITDLLQRNLGQLSNYRGN